MSENTSESASDSKESFQLGCGFIVFIGIVALVVGLMFLGKTDVKIVDGVAQLRERGGGGFITPEMVATNTVSHVYEIATKHSEVKQIVVTVYCPKRDAVDKYGKEANDDVVIGTLTIDDLAEIRRYESSEFYSARAHDLLAAEIRRMPRARLMKLD